MKKSILFFCFILFFCSVRSQQISGDTLVSDFKYLVKILEETHPDPYTGYGGKVFFHKQVFDIEQRLKSGATLDEFTSQLSSFISSLDDGHTYIEKAQSSSANIPNLMLPLEAMVIPDGIVVSKVPSKYRKLLGSKLTGINDIPIAELCEEVGKIVPRENIYDKYSWLSMCIGYYRQMKRLLPEMSERIYISLETIEGNKESIKLFYVDSKNLAKIEVAEAPKWSKVRDEYLYYDYLDENKQVMYYRLSSIMTREAFLFMKENGWGGFNEMLESLYKNDLRKELPTDVDEAIDKIPDIAETFRAMLEKMKEDKAKYLAIDLRSNGGGFTPSILPTLYMLYGDGYLEKDMGINFYRLISPLYMNKINMTLEELNRKNNTSYQFGDYDFSIQNEKNDATIEERRKQFVDQAIGDAAEYIKDMDGKPVYTPLKVFVIVDQRTFSAAFHYAFYLWKMGATIVGVPPRQAPNTYMEVTPFQLPLIKINGSISNTFQQFLPAEDKRAKIFYPDIMLSREDYSKYKFDKYSDLLYLIDLLGLK